MKRFLLQTEGKPNVTLKAVSVADSSSYSLHKRMGRLPPCHGSTKHEIAMKAILVIGYFAF